MKDHFFGPALVLASELACALDLYADDHDLHETWRASVDALQEVKLALADFGLPVPCVVTHVLQRANQAALAL